MIPFNKPYFSGNEINYIRQAIGSGHISGNGEFTRKCHRFFCERYGFKKCLLSTSCTDALEMAAILIDIKIDDEVIMPSYTFVSTANPFVLRGAKIVFADSNPLNPNINADKIEELITPKTKAIVPVHYAGIACDMDKIMAIAGKYNLFVVEDAAQSIESYHKNQPIGSIGHLAAFSFHETKNIVCGEGGMLVINDDHFIKRAEIIWEKGTNRAEFFRGDVDKYGWKDIGSSFLPSDLIAAFLFAQLENIEAIQAKRKQIWQLYYEELKKLEEQGFVKLPYIPEYATNNSHLFYVLCKNQIIRDGLLSFLKIKQICAVFHYLPLHKSDFYSETHGSRQLPWCDYYGESLIRLPVYCELSG
ncbi:MAG: dTDP-4-amino-4,6-dideoxygalactose transaminase, partial [Deltaproteobacteria bacterium]